MNTTVCSGSALTITPVNVTNGIVPTATTYSWSAPTVTGEVSGCAASVGTSASINGTLVNTTTLAQTAIYTVTPTTGSCQGNAFQFSNSKIL